MPPKSVAKASSASTSKCRRSVRIAYRIKSMVNGRSAFLKKQPSTKERGKLPNRKKSVAKTQPASSKGGEPSCTKESGKPSYSKKTVTKRQPASSNGGQSTSTKKSTVKRRRVMKMDEINERASQMGLERQQDFSIYITKILGELSPDLIISKKAIADMNIYLDHVFKRLARTSAIFLIGRNDVSMTDKDMETAVLHVIEGELAKYCIAEGRRAVKKSNEE
ncbi:hypothetical protein AVEN_164010-1 [Araneus ventricosus]|uniref:Uncharacterized protein n=1 Tax=Araneus ventricosus TaxID=182803 RepID=A0A4Y2DAB6_ARAVE|nr:hypothetical protein AVEN_164010-1 [Araneus ventricosus]